MVVIYLGAGSIQIQNMMHILQTQSELKKNGMTKSVTINCRSVAGMIFMPHLLVIFVHQFSIVLARGGPTKESFEERITLDVQITLLSDEIVEPPSYMVASLSRSGCGLLACFRELKLVQNFTCCMSV
jgi:hypothetical protein